jgi:hypothetical protein
VRHGRTHAKQHQKNMRILHNRIDDTQPQRLAGVAHVCVCVCACARVCVCVCACLRVPVACFFGAKTQLWVCKQAKQASKQASKAFMAPGRSSCKSRPDAERPATPRKSGSPPPALPPYASTRYSNGNLCGIPSGSPRWRASARRVGG